MNFSKLHRIDQAITQAIKKTKKLLDENFNEKMGIKSSEKTKRQLKIKRLILAQDKLLVMKKIEIRK